MEWPKAGFAPFLHMGVSGPRPKGKDQEAGIANRSVSVCGLPKGTRRGLFYSPQDKKVFVSTNATFLENTYMTDFKPRSKPVLEELQSDEIRPSPSTTGERQRRETTSPSQNILAPRRSGRVVRQPTHYGHEGEVGL